MKSADKVQWLLRRAGVTTNRATDDAVFQNLKKAYTRTGQPKSAQGQPSIWRLIMRSPLTKLAVAAVVVLACVIGVSLWRSTGSGIALADVLAQVEKARSVRWVSRFRMSSDAAPGRPASPEERVTFLFSRDWGQTVIRERTDPNGGQTPLAEIYFSLQKKIGTFINHPAKTYTRTELDDAVFQRAREIMSQATDEGTYVKRIMKCKHESLGRSTIDGVEVEGFRTTDPNIGGFPGIVNPQVEGKIWVDVKTRMPVRSESLGSGVARTGGRISMHEVLDHFQWDLPLTAAEFEPPAVPNGYVVVADNLLGPITEEGTIQGLKQCVELLGKYPGDAIIALPGGIQSALDGSDSPAATRLKEELKGLTEQDRVNRLMEVGIPLRRVDRFVNGLNAQGKAPAYYGKTVTPKDADKVLLRWKLSDSEYRVVFGDLHAQTVSPERLAELEKAPPK